MFNQDVKPENFRNMYSECFKQLRELSPEYFISIAVQNNVFLSLTSVYSEMSNKSGQNINDVSSILM